MLRSSMIFFILGITSMIFGAYEIANISVEIGKVLLMIFIVLAILSFMIELIRGKG